MYIYMYVLYSFEYSDTFFLQGSLFIVVEGLGE